MIFSGTLFSQMLADIDRLGQFNFAGQFNVKVNIGNIHIYTHTNNVKHIEAG